MTLSNRWPWQIMVASLVSFGLGGVAFGQLPHAPVPPGADPQTAAAMAQHQALMMKLFDLNGDGILEPNEIALAKSGLGPLLEKAADGTLGGVTGQAAGAGGKGLSNLLAAFDQNGNGQLDLAELRMAQTMMAMLAGGSGMRPATGYYPVMTPDYDPHFGANPAPSASKRGRRQRAAKVADFAKAKAAPAKQALAPRQKKVKAAGPMVERQLPKVNQKPPNDAAVSD